MNREELKQKSVKELKELAKSLGLTGYSNKKEDELIELILNAVNEKELSDGNKKEKKTEKVAKIKFKKLFKGNLILFGKNFKEDFELSEEEAKDKRVQVLIKAGLIKKV